MKKNLQLLNLFILVLSLLFSTVSCERDEDLILVENEIHQQELTREIVDINEVKSYFDEFDESNIANGKLRKTNFSLDFSKGRYSGVLGGKNLFFVPYNRETELVFYKEGGEIKYKLMRYIERGETIEESILVQLNEKESIKDIRNNKFIEDIIQRSEDCFGPKSKSDKCFDPNSFPRWLDSQWKKVTNFFGGIRFSNRGGVGNNKNQYVFTTTVFGQRYYGFSTSTSRSRIMGNRLGFRYSNNIAKVYYQGAELYDNATISALTVMPYLDINEKENSYLHKNPELSQTVYYHLKSRNFTRTEKLKSTKYVKLQSNSKSFRAYPLSMSEFSKIYSPNIETVFRIADELNLSNLEIKYLLKNVQLTLSIYDYLDRNNYSSQAKQRAKETIKLMQKDPEPWLAKDVRICKESFNFKKVGLGFTTEVTNIVTIYSRDFVNWAVHAIPVLCIQVKGKDKNGKSLTSTKAAELLAFAMENSFRELVRDFSSNWTQQDFNSYFKIELQKQVTELTGGKGSFSISTNKCFGKIPNQPYKVKGLFGNCQEAPNWF